MDFSGNMGDGSSAAAVFLILGMILVFSLLFLIPYIFFCNSLYKALKLVPEGKLDQPAYFAWFLLIPVAGIVFIWMVAAFNVPRSFERVVEGDAEGVKQAKSLSGLGLAYAILATVGFLPFISFLAAIPLLIIWIIYWVKVVEFREKFLDRLKVEEPQKDDPYKTRSADRYDRGPR